METVYTRSVEKCVLDHFEDLGIDGRTLKQIFERWDMMMRAGLKTDSCGGLLWRRYWSFGLYKCWRISLLDGLLLASGATPSLFVIQGLGRPVPGRGNSWLCVCTNALAQHFVRGLRALCFFYEKLLIKGVMGSSVDLTGTRFWHLNSIHLHRIGHCWERVLCFVTEREHACRNEMKT